MQQMRAKFGSLLIFDRLEQLKLDYLLFLDEMSTNLQRMLNGMP